jgi:hypothetical protein
MNRTFAIGLCGVLAFGSVLPLEAVARTICLSSGPIENIGESFHEGQAEAPVNLAARFFTVNLLNNSKKPATFEARFYQIDGPGDWEGGTWPETGKAKVLLSSGKRDPVAVQGGAFLNTDVGDDPEPVYGLEAQVKITGVGRRQEYLVTGHARAENRLKIVPELRILNTEWTEIPCGW